MEKKEENCNGGGKKFGKSILYSTYIYVFIWTAPSVWCGGGRGSGSDREFAYTCTDAKQRVMYCYTHIQFGKWPPKE